MTVRIANCGAFWGDDPRAPRHTLSHATDLDYLTMDYLAEVTMTVLARQEESDPDRGYARTFEKTVSELLPDIVEADVTIVANAGGTNPAACQRAVFNIAEEAGVDLEVGLVDGDDFSDRIDDFDHDQLQHAYKDVPLPRDAEVLSANAYFGALPIADALDEGADIVVTGRVIDAAMTMGPLIHEFDWPPGDYDRLARGMMAGHVIECGTQATGGNYLGEWRDVEFENIGFPIAEVSDDGRTEFTKPSGTGGKVTVGTIAEQLLYETGDPKNYEGPDVCADFQDVSLEAVGTDRVRIIGVEGEAPSPMYKASLHYQDGYQVTGALVYSRPNPREKAERFAKSVQRRADTEHIDVREYVVEYLGEDALHRTGGGDPEEVAVRIGAKTDSKKAAHRFSGLYAAMAMSGPPSATMLTEGRPKPSPNYVYHPVLVPKNEFEPQTEVVST